MAQCIYISLTDTVALLEDEFKKSSPRDGISLVYPVVELCRLTLPKESSREDVFRSNLQDESDRMSEKRSKNGLNCEIQVRSSAGLGCHLSQFPFRRTQTSRPNQCCEHETLTYIL